MFFHQITKRSVIRFFLVLTGVILLCLVIALLVLRGLESHLVSQIPNDIQREVFSPDRKFRAVVFRRSAGAFSSGSTHISILSANQALPKDAGNVFTSDRSSVSIAWSDDHTLGIMLSDPGIIWRAESHWHTINIKYE